MSAVGAGRESCRNRCGGPKGKKNENRGPREEVYQGGRFMSSISQSFREWLVGKIESVLSQTTSPPPFLIWCDPEEEWLDLLRTASESSDFRLWAPERRESAEHELIIRDRWHKSERTPRVIWLPVSQKEITWFKVFELEAQTVWEKTLIQALRDYGVRIPREHEMELNSLLPAHAKEWFDEPKTTWKELTPGSAKGTLMDDHRMLQVLAAGDGEFSRLEKEDRFAIFARRATEDFGLPDPTGMDEKGWRIAATARLLATEAAQGSPESPPSEGDRIIPPGLARDRALQLLKAWQSNIHYIPSFERFVQKADGTLGLTYWARNLSTPPRSYSSRAVEETLLERLTTQLDCMEELEALIHELERNLQVVKRRQEGFWGTLATHAVGWKYLVQLADAASLLVENAESEQLWKSAMDAVEWYSSRGWQLDQAGETLFLESPEMPKNLHRTRARLRRGYLRAFDRINRAFSDLLAANFDDILGLPTAGEIAQNVLEASRGPTSIIFLDACRLDLGYRLVGLLNESEPVERATLQIAAAPVPTITALGMAFAMPVKREIMTVTLSEDKNSFCVKAEGFEGDLILAEQRRKWLGKNIGVKEFLTISDVLDSDKLKSPGRSRKVLIVHGSEFDSEGHEGQLKLEGAEDHLERYARTIRRLQTIGYKRIIIVTDHGFFHWQPEVDEVQEKPSGELLWISRRAVVGRSLSHPSAVRLPVLSSDLEAMVPRSVNAFRTYGGLGFFHGGATLQELVIPVIVASWPAKAAKVDVVLKPVGHISSETPRVQIQAGTKGQGKLFADANQLARRAVVKIKNPSTGKIVFLHPEPVTVQPEGDAETVQLQLVDPRPTLSYGTSLVVEVLDAEDEEILDREEIKLKVDIDEW